MTDIHTCAHLLPDGEQACGRVGQVEVGVHLQLGHLVRHVQERLGVHDGGSKGWSYERSMDRGKEGGFWVHSLGHLIHTFGLAEYLC